MDKKAKILGSLVSLFVICSMIIFFFMECDIIFDVPSPFICRFECFPPEKQCSGDGYQICERDPQSRCTKWSDVINCAKGETCSKGICGLNIMHCVYVVDMGNYYIDKYEASRPDATSSDVGSDNSMVCSIAFELPSTEISWDEAKEACKARGEGWRLCSGSEWEDACDGTVGEGGYTYPYGDTYKKKTCNGDDAGYEEAIPTGFKSGCKSDKDAYDMSGNVWEWTEEQDVDPRGLRGGSWLSSSDYLHCSSRVYRDPAYSTISFGFRCCKDKTNYDECTDECSTEGAKQCSRNGYQTCGYYDSDECLDWSSVTNCGSSEICQNGECLSDITANSK